MLRGLQDLDTHGNLHEYLCVKCKGVYFSKGM